MTSYEITSPDGKKFEITAPEGATQDQVLAYAQEQFKAQPAAPSQRDVRLTEPAVPPPPSALDKTQQFLRGAFNSRPFNVLGGAVMKGVDDLSNYAGGAATDAAVKVLPPEGAAAVGTAVNVGLPSLLGGGIGGRAAPMLEKAGTNMMISALKPSKAALKAGDAERAAQTMFAEGANVTEAGVTKLRDKIGTLNDELQTALNSSPATVDKNAIASRLQDVISKIETSSFNPQQRVKAVEKIYNDVLGNATLAAQIPVSLANKIKSGIYKELGDLKYQRMRTGTPISDAEAANAALAKGAKEEIASAVPSAAPLNAEMSKLIKAANMSEDAVLMASKRDPGGFALLTHNLTRLIGMLAARDPATKSMLARALYGGADTITAGTGAVAGSAAHELDQQLRNTRQ